MEQKIKEGLEQIRPFLQRDGGDIEFVEYTDCLLYTSSRQSKIWEARRKSPHRSKPTMRYGSWMNREIPVPQKKDLPPFYGLCWESLPLRWRFR